MCSSELVRLSEDLRRREENREVEVPVVEELKEAIQRLQEEEEEEEEVSTSTEEQLHASDGFLFEY